MTDLEKKILNIAKKHPDYDEARAVKELQVLSDMDLIEELWKLRDKVGNENRLNLALAYYIGITNSKPTDEFKLEKRRTYGRAGFPDIDMDFDYVRRGEIIEYLIEKYGREYVGNIGTIQTFKTKAAVRRAVKVSDPANSIRFDSNGNKIKNDDNANFALENEILQSLPKLMKRGDGSQVESVMEAYNEYPSFAKYMDAYPKVYRIAKSIEGTMSGYGCLFKETVVKTEHGHCRIDQINNSMKISYVDFDGHVKLTNNFFAHKTGNKKCYKITLNDGSWIKVTDEHLLFTNKGCVVFKKIRQNPENYQVWSLKK